MAQESISRSGGKSSLNTRIAIIGAGPAGCICTYYLLKAGYDVSLFDKGKFLRTLLPTGGGRCNLAHAEYDFKNLAKNYPRGEKFLYSVFSRFNTQDTLDFFEKIEVKTYTQDDNRIFPTSNSAKEVRGKILTSIRNAKFIKENVFRIEKINSGYKIVSERSTYLFDKVIVAIGGHAGFDLLSSNLGLNIITPTESLVGLKTVEDLSSLSGIKMSNVEITVDKKSFSGDLLFTHQGVSGPVIYTISSVFARKEFPYEIKFKFADLSDKPQYFLEKSEMDLSNQLKPYLPKSVTKYILKTLGKEDSRGTHTGRTTQKLLTESLKDFRLNVNAKMTGREVVTCGGVDLKEVNPKTLESKKYDGLYFCGEVLDIDGFCGGFNLQNCWSTGFIVAESIKNSLK